MDCRGCRYHLIISLFHCPPQGVLKCVFPLDSHRRTVSPQLQPCLTIHLICLRLHSKFYRVLLITPPPPPRPPHPAPVPILGLTVQQPARQPTMSPMTKLYGVCLLVAASTVPSCAFVAPLALTTGTSRSNQLRAAVVRPTSDW